MGFLTAQPVTSPATRELAPQRQRLVHLHAEHRMARALTDEVGLSQRQIATRTGQSQSEAADIIGGRKVESHSLLRRIAKGLGIPPELMGLSWSAVAGTYCGEVTDADVSEEVSAEMLRRHLLALGATAAFGVPIKGLGELLSVGTPAPAPLPSP